MFVLLLLILQYVLSKARKYREILPKTLEVKAQKKGVIFTESVIYLTLAKAALASQYAQAQLQDTLL